MAEVALDAALRAAVRAEAGSLGWLVMLGPVSGVSALIGAVEDHPGVAAAAWVNVALAVFACAYSFTQRQRSERLLTRVVRHRTDLRAGGQLEGRAETPLRIESALRRSPVVISCFPMTLRGQTALATTDEEFARRDRAARRITALCGWWSLAGPVETLRTLAPSAVPFGSSGDDTVAVPGTDLLGARVTLGTGPLSLTVGEAIARIERDAERRRAPRPGLMELRAQDAVSGRQALLVTTAALAALALGGWLYLR